VRTVEPPTILVVDDDRANLRTFQRVFRKQHRLLLAGSGAEALQLLGARSSVHLAFVDYTMPQMNGQELLGLLRERHPRVVRFLLTGFVDLPAVLEMRASGLAFDVLPKPWSKDLIETAVSGVIACTQPLP
jgi:response regulator RpfG family c-di-GMP phosphodiesterase